MADKVICIIQCRMSSSRLPRKAMLDLCGKPLLLRVIERCRAATRIDDVIVATSTEEEDGLIELVCGHYGVHCFRGSLSDVRSRYIELARRFHADVVVRVTADNPLTEPRYIDLLVDEARRDPTMAYAIMNRKMIPLGSGSEVFRANALFESAQRFGEVGDLEHVTPSIMKMFPTRELEPPEELRLEGDSVGIDTFSDYLKAWRTYLRFGDDPDILKHYIRDKKTGAP